MAHVEARGPRALAIARPWGRVGSLAEWLSPQTLVWLGMSALLVVLVLWPMYHLVYASLKTPTGLSLANYEQLLGMQRFHEAFRNSIVLGLACGVIGMLIGTPLAWLCSRTNVPGRAWIRFGVLGAFVAPGFVNALSWTLLAGPNAGLLNKIWMALTGADSGIFNIFSLNGMIFVSLATVYPLAFLFMYNAFEMMDTEIEDAARVLGASPLRVFFTITLPLAWPAFLGGFILMFLESLILYGVPAVIGVPARVYVMTTQIWTLFEYPPRLGLAAALSMPMLLITVVLLWMQRRMLARRSFVTFTGKGGRQRRIDLGPWKWPAVVFAFTVIFFTFILPTLMLLSASVLKQAYRGFALDNLTLANYHYVLFSYEAGTLSIRNSVLTSAVAATVGVLMAAVIAYIAERKLVRFGGMLAFLAMLPLVIPAMVFAVGLFAAYTQGPIVLYGTLWIIILAYLTKHLPFPFMSANAALASVHTELESAANILGASKLRVLRDITAPMIKGGLLAGWILVFTPAVKELSASILLYTRQTTVIPTAIMDAYLLPSWEAVASLSIILLLINAVVILVGYRLLGGNLFGGRQGA